MALDMPPPSDAARVYAGVDDARFSISLAAEIFVDS